MGGGGGPGLPVPLGLGRKGRCRLRRGVQRWGEPQDPGHGCQGQLGCRDPPMEGAVGRGPIATAVGCQGIRSLPGEGLGDTAAPFAVPLWHGSWQGPSALAEPPRCALATAVGLEMLRASAEPCFGVQAGETSHPWAR